MFMAPYKQAASLPLLSQKKKGKCTPSKGISSQTDVVRMMFLMLQAPGYRLPDSGKLYPESSSGNESSDPWWEKLIYSSKFRQEAMKLPPLIKVYAGHYNISTLSPPLLIHPAVYLLFWPNVAHWADILIEPFIMMPRSFLQKVPANSEPIRPISVWEL